MGARVFKCIAFLYRKWIIVIVFLLKDKAGKNRARIDTYCLILSKWNNSLEKQLIIIETYCLKFLSIEEANSWPADWLVLRPISPASKVLCCVDNWHAKIEILCIYHTVWQLCPTGSAQYLSPINWTCSPQSTLFTSPYHCMIPCQSPAWPQS